jgi:hypothetical protein
MPGFLFQFQGRFLGDVGSEEVYPYCRALLALGSGIMPVKDSHTGIPVKPLALASGHRPRPYLHSTQDTSATPERVLVSGVHLEMAVTSLAANRYTSLAVLLLILKRLRLRVVTACIKIHNT